MALIVGNSTSCIAVLWYLLARFNHCTVKQMYVIYKQHIITNEILCTRLGYNRCTLQTATLKCNSSEGFYNLILYLVVSKSKPCKRIWQNWHDLIITKSWIPQCLLFAVAQLCPNLSLLSILIYHNINLASGTDES